VHASAARESEENEESEESASWQQRWQSARSLFLRRALEWQFLGELLGLAVTTHVQPLDRLAAVLGEGAPDVQKALQKLEADNPAVDWHAAALRGVEGEQRRGVLKGHKGWTGGMAPRNADLPAAVWAELAAALAARGRPVVLSRAPDDAASRPAAVRRWWAGALPGARVVHRPAGYGRLHVLDPACQEAVFRGMMGETGAEVLGKPQE
jgi:hypothetical protein